MAGLLRSGLVALRAAPQLLATRGVATTPRAAGGVLWGGGLKGESTACQYPPRADTHRSPALTTLPQ